MKDSTRTFAHTFKNLFIAKGLNVLKIIFSLAATPWVIFISTSVALYLKNQRELYYKNEVLCPFIIIFLIIYALALIAFILSKDKSNKYVVWGYYLFVFLFFAYRAIKYLSLSLVVKAILLSVPFFIYLFLIFQLNRKVKIQQAVNFFAVLSLLYIACDGYSFISGYESYQPRNLQKQIPTEFAFMTYSSQKNLPNIYHLVFDEYQSDMFSLTLNPEVRKDLAGFVFFPETTCSFGRTEMSFSSFFTGKKYDFTYPQLTYQHDAFLSHDSTLYWLKVDGYRLVAYIPKIFDFDLELFDDVVVHMDNCQIEDIPVWPTYRKLWIYDNLPKFVSRKFIDVKRIRQIKAQNLLPRAAPISSLLSFNNYLQEEKYFSARNRYTLVYLILPHFPYVLNADCTYSVEDVTTSPLEQSKCATHMISHFINALKKLNRFNNSLVIIQSDHGARFKVENGELISLEAEGHESLGWIRARSRSLLLIKPAGVADDKEFIISPAQAILRDVAPTIFESLGLRTEQKFDGQSLVNPIVTDLKRTRHFHFYEKIGPGDWTDTMTRYRIDDSGIAKESVIKLENNPQPK